MQIVLPRSEVVDERAYLVTSVGAELPALNRLPASVAQAAKRLAGELETRPDRRSRRTDVEEATLVVYRLKPGEELVHERLASWTHTIAKLAEELAGDVAVLAPPLPVDAERAVRVLTALELAGYRFRRFRSGAGENNRSPAVEQRRTLLIPPSRQASAWRRARSVAAAVADGIRWTRDLANTPPNEATPKWIADQARDYFRSVGGRVEVLATAGLTRRGMGGLLAVGGGSANAPRCVRVRIGERGPRVALVGKGVTFDTGGISIKPAAAMDEMKYDKSGACAVMGIGRAVARLELPVQLELYLPLAENMPDGSAYRPSDIVRCRNGKTVEVLNTDAEGRMILADALSWAAEGAPDFLIDYATLTGACVVALGEKTAGLFSHDDDLADALLAAASGGGEYLWRLPLWSHFGEQMKGYHADLKNIGPRWGGASTAAAFLHEFTGEIRRWAHIDLAGPACGKLSGGKRKEATGYGVAMTVNWLRSLG